MQQTETYKLNKPGMDDKFSVEPLNENADKVEAELGRVDGERAALDQRVVTLENCRVLLGTYDGTGKMDREIELGERPLAVIVCGWSTENSHMGLAVGDVSLISQNSRDRLFLTDNGFQVPSYLDTSSYTFSFIAFFGDWDTTHIPKP